MTADPWGPHTTVVRTPVPAGQFEFERTEVAPGRLRPIATYAFDGVVASDVEFDLTDTMLDVQHSEFDRCRFVQQRRPASDGSWGPGSLGRRRSVYRDCVFHGVRFRIRAGYSVGCTTFERCEFVRCDFGELFSFCADYVDCAFTGVLKTAVFYGRSPNGHHCDGKVNEFRGNDFTAASLGDVGFYGGLDPTEQLWADGFDPISFFNE